jgi:TetR/AcrR family transcriptional regulator, fatty acid metabolism regulator protein
MTATSTRRVFMRLPRERREQDIIAAARAVFAEYGYEKAAMTEIAARAGVVEGTIYKYFANKRDVLLQVLARWYEDMLANYEEHLVGIKGTRNRLRFVIWRHLKAIHGDPALCRVFFLEIRAEDDYYRSPVYELNRSYTRFALDVVRDGIAAGELRNDVELSLLRDLIYGTIEHHTWNYVSGRGGLDIEMLADQLTDLVLAGLSRHPTSAAPLAATAERLERVAERLEKLERKTTKGKAP